MILKSEYGRRFPSEKSALNNRNPSNLIYKLGNAAPTGITASFHALWVGLLAEGRMRAKMYEIVKAEKLTPDVIKLEIKAPHIAKKAKAARFIRAPPTEHGERGPLRMAAFLPGRGTIKVAAV